jgi:hypothetical protein
MERYFTFFELNEGNEKDITISYLKDKYTTKYRYTSRYTTKIYM